VVVCSSYARFARINRRRGEAGWQLVQSQVPRCETTVRTIGWPHASREQGRPARPYT
jgi:hypothetical protein